MGSKIAIACQGGGSQTAFAAGALKALFEARVRDSSEIVRKPADQQGFAVHPRRWVVERTFAWLGRNRRLARDFEATIASAMLLIRRLARS